MSDDKAKCFFAGAITQEWLQAASKVLAIVQDLEKVPKSDLPRDLIKDKRDEAVQNLENALDSLKRSAPRCDIQSVPLIGDFERQIRISQEKIRKGEPLAVFDIPETFLLHGAD